MPEERAERTDYQGLLALMEAGADTQNWSYPYWNVIWLDAIVNALANAPRTGVVPLLAPTVAPTLAISATAGILPGGLSLDVAQTWVDEYGRETEAGPVEDIETSEGIGNPTIAPVLTRMGDGADGFEGGTLNVWYSWVDSSGGETLPSTMGTIELPYLAGGLKSTVLVVLPLSPDDVGCAEAHVYIQHRAGNIVHADTITGASTSVELDGIIEDCARSLPLVNSTGSVNAIDITGITPAPDAAVKTRFYIRSTGATWADSDQRLCISGADEWDVDTVSYPLVYTGQEGTLVPGFPPQVSQVKAIRPIDLGTETVGTVDIDNMPAIMTKETELVRSTGIGVMSGLEVTQTTPASMAVDVGGGEVLIGGVALPYGENLMENPRLKDTDTDGIADDITEEETSLNGTPLYSCPSLQQRVQYTGVTGDAAGSLGMLTNFVVGESVGVTVSVRVAATLTGCTARVALYNQADTLIDEATITGDGVERLIELSGTTPAGTTSVDVYWTIIEGIADTDVADIYFTKAKFAIEDEITPYFDGEEEFCGWYSTTDESVSYRLPHNENEVGRYILDNETLVIPTADLADPRIDIICVSDEGVLEGPTENSALKGAPAGTPSVPATPDGYMLLAQVYVEAAATTISDGSITDERFMLITLRAAIEELRAEDADIAEDLQDHIDDAEAHSSQPGTMSTVNKECLASSSTDFVVSDMPVALITEVLAVATSGGAIDYDLYFYSDSGRTTLQYQAGEGSGAGIQVATFRDRIPFEWFGGSTVYVRVTNYSAVDISNLALTIKYRK